jgi:hypothetical protein
MRKLPTSGKPLRTPAQYSKQGRYQARKMQDGNSFTQQGQPTFGSGTLNKKTQLSGSCVPTNNSVAFVPMK